MDPQQLQLQLIEEVTTFLQSANVPHWLFGGWAVDFLVGEITRPHDDVDFVIWARDAQVVRRMLAQHRYTESVTHSSTDTTIFYKQEQRLEIVFIDRNQAGQIVTPGVWADWPWLAGTFEEAPARLGDLMCPVTSAASLLETKERYAQHPAGEPLREKDVADIERLRALLARSSARATQESRA